jgi:SPX domain protein involved in polyphosphate accumulation
VEPLATMKRSPGEILFFKLLHFEFQKAVSFFDQVIVEFTIREERIVHSVGIVKQGNRCQLWATLTKCVYSLYSDLLLLESFCIMTYCSFSKILKKHDKVTGLDTRNAFMSNVVNNANFTNYTKLQEMITRCEDLYSSVSEKMIQEGRQDLDEDERLFIEMVHQMNRQKR